MARSWAPGRARRDVARSAGGELVLEAGDAHLEELVEVLAEDREELRPVRAAAGPASSARASTRALNSSHDSSSVQESRAGRAVVTRADRPASASQTRPGRGAPKVGRSAIGLSGPRPLRDPTASLGRRMPYRPAVPPADALHPARAPQAASVIGDGALAGSRRAPSSSGHHQRRPRQGPARPPPDDGPLHAIVTPVLGLALDRIQGGRRLITVVSASAGPCLPGRDPARTSPNPRPRACSSTRSPSAPSCFGKGYSISRPRSSRRS